MKKKLSIILMILITACLFAAGQVEPQKATYVIVESGQIRTIEEGVVTLSALPSGPTYKEVVIAVTNVGAEEFKLRSNIYLPTMASAIPTPLVLYVHGHGGAYNFSSGSRSYEFAIALKERGIAVATIDYRYEGNMVENTYEVKSYVRYFKAHAEEYNIDPERIGVWGTSRGGHLAAIMASSGDVAALEGKIGEDLDYNSDVACVVIYYPLTDLFLSNEGQFPGIFLNAPNDAGELIREAHLTNDTSSPLWEYVEMARLVNPITYVSENDPPVLLACSSKDPITPSVYSIEMYNKYVEAGVDASLYLWAHGTHGQVGLDIEAASSEWIVKKLMSDLVSDE